VDHKRHHKSDGIIFTPDDPYHAKTTPNLFKWKYLDQISIDLKIQYKANRTAIYFTCGGPDGIDIEYPINLKPEDVNKLNRDLSIARAQTTVIIAEFAYDQNSGLWLYKMIRNDKHKANFVKTIFETLEVICENIPIEEIVYRTPLESRNDDWKHQLKKAYTAIMDRQHAKPAQHAPPQQNPAQRAPAVWSPQMAMSHNGTAM
jgi:hypothetical protein